MFPAWSNLLPTIRCKIATLTPCEVGNVWQCPFCPRLCCKSLFASLDTNFSSCRRGDRIIMWGTTSSCDELTGGFGDGLEATSTGDCRLFRLLAENSSHGILGLLQHNPPSSGLSHSVAPLPKCAKTGSGLSFDHVA